jgi:hypothetical protein
MIAQSCESILSQMRDEIYGKSTMIDGASSTLTYWKYGRCI